MGKRLTKRHQVYAQVSPEEYSVVQALARQEALSVSDYVRRCVNSVLLEAGDDVPLLEEQGYQKRHGPRRLAS